MRAIVDDAPFGVATGVIGSWLDHVNPTLCEWLGFSLNELVGRNRDTVLERSSAVKLGSWLERLEVGETAGPVRLDLRHKTGATVPLNVHLRKVADPSQVLRLFAYATRAGTTALPFHPPDSERRVRGALEATLADCRERLRLIAERLDAARAEERQELAFLLHDGTSQDLLAIVLHLNRMAAIVDQFTPMAERVAEAQMIANQAQLELRKLMSDLRSPPSPNAPVDVLLQRRAQELQTRYGVPIEVAVPRLVQLNAERANTIARVGSEAMLNAIKHSGCTNIVVRLSMLPRKVSLLVIDDGCGGVVLSRSQVATLGLASMRARAHRLSASLRIRSPRGRGTAVLLRVPLD
jgi:PAS domain S-box-containing protein